jgi:hypothetical protein
MRGVSIVPCGGFLSGFKMNVEKDGGHFGCVWAVNVVEGGQICVGDSSGNVTFFDGRNGAVLQPFQQDSSGAFMNSWDCTGGGVYSGGGDGVIVGCGWG